LSKKAAESSDKDTFFTHLLCAQEVVQPQGGIELETLRSRVQCVTATLTSCAGLKGSGFLLLHSLGHYKLFSFSTSKRCLACFLQAYEKLGSGSDKL